MKNVKILILIICFVCTITLSSCGKVTSKNFEKIKRDLTTEDVIDILGKPDDIVELSNGSMYFYFDKASSRENATSKVEKGKEVYYIYIQFVQNKVLYSNDGYWKDYLNSNKK